MDLQRTEETVKAAFGISLALRIAASWFGRSGYRSRDTRDALARWNTHTRWRTLTARGIGLLLRLPYFFGAVIQFIWYLVTRPFLWLCAVAAWWFLYQPPSSAWEAIPSTLSGLLASFSPSVAAAWITVLTFVIAVLFVSIRWRATNSWRTSRYEHAHVLLHDTALTAGKTLSAIDKAVKARAHDLPTMVSKAASELTSTRCEWDTTSHSLRYIKNHTWDYRSMVVARQNEAQDDAADAREALNALVTEFRDGNLHGLQRELWRITPRRATDGLGELAFRRNTSDERWPWYSDLFLLSSDWKEIRVKNFLERNWYLAQKFSDADKAAKKTKIAGVTETEKADSDDIEEAEQALLDFADDLHDEISEAFWAVEEILSLATATRRHLNPSLWSVIIGSITKK